MGLCATFPPCIIIILVLPAFHTSADFDISERSLVAGSLVPNILHGDSQLGVCLVQCALHFNVQRRPVEVHLILLILQQFSRVQEPAPDEGEKRWFELHCSVVIERHVHGYKPLAGDTGRAELAEPKRGVDLPQQRHHVHVLDPAVREQVRSVLFY